MSPMMGKAWFSSDAHHKVAVLSLRHRAVLASSTFFAAARKVGALRRRLSARGSRPLATAARCSSALVRASARLTSGQAPSPISRRRPSTVTRRTQHLDPDSYTRKIRPCPSWCFPGPAFLALAAVSDGILSPNYWGIAQQ